MTGSLVMEVGGMYAEKTTALQRHGKRYMLAGKKVVFLKPAIDDRYSEDEIVTHDGQKVKAINVEWRTHLFMVPKEAYEADVVCIDEIQFFPYSFIEIIDKLIHQGKKVFCAGLDLDRFGKPFEIVSYLMARAEEVHKHHAVCRYCGEDAWVTIGNDSLQNTEQINVGNEYIPVCRSCAYEHGGVI